MLANSYSAQWFSLFLHRVSPEQTTREVEFIAQHLERDSWILDLPCGTGRHARRLAERGHRVVAVDRDPTLLGKPAAPSVDWIGADMRTLPLARGRFDAIICLWQSFGYFGAGENESLLRRWADLVRPGGNLILDLYHRSFFEAHQGERQMEESGSTIRERRTMRGDRLIVELTYEGLHRGDRFEWQLFTPEDLEQLASRCGWRLHFSCSGFDPRQAPDPQRPRVQYVLERCKA
jgi:SAM-dependent methyltransferase